MGWKTSELPRYTVSAAQLSKGMSISPMLGLHYREVCTFKCTCGREPEYAYMLVHAQLWVCFHVWVGFWMCESSCLFACAWCMCTCMPLNYIFQRCLFLSLLWKKKTNKKHLVFLYAYPFISQVFCVCNPLQIKFEICGQRKLALEAWCFVYWYLLWYFYNPDSKIVVKNMTEDRIQSFANELYWLFNQ